MNEKNNKWKTSLLKTGLPLEHLVAEQLSNKGFEIKGEYSYIRKNEQNINTEFSVDLHASKLIKKGKDNYWADLNFLVECKYNYRGVKWIFSPHSKESYIAGGVLNTFDQLCTRKLNNTKLINALDDDLYYCVKGIELHETDSNAQSITRGLYQLKYAVPQLAKSIHQFQMFMMNDEDLYISFVCPILVATASLYVMKSDLNLNQIEEAEDLEAITEEVDFLLIHQGNKSQLEEYTNDIIFQLHFGSPHITERLDSLAKIQDKHLSDSLPKTFYLDSMIKHSAENVLVITYNSFENVIDKIHKAVIKSGKYLKQVATLRKDITKGRAWAEPIKFDEDLQTEINQWEAASDEDLLKFG